jgi:deoxyribonuclease V
VRIERLHGWKVTTQQAREIQLHLADRVLQEGRLDSPRFIAGVDMSVDRIKGTASAAVVVVDFPALRPVEVQTAQGDLEFPYVPGLLSFREIPLTIAACEKLQHVPDLFLVDGQGYAHPRRIGLASHLGLFLDMPTIGCAKSKLCGECEIPGNERGSISNIIDNGEIIGAALRTQTGKSPLYVSIGHKIDLPASIQWILECCRDYRLPEPARLAHLASRGNIIIKDRGHSAG